MKLYNSLTDKIEDFEPLTDKIGIYSCGPTLYKNGHIGNLASAIYADTLVRTLSYAFPKKQILQVMNFTDIDDKTVKESAKKFPKLPAMERLAKLTSQIEQEVIADYKAVGIDTNGIKFVRATEHIDEMQALINKLLASDIAYTAEDGIYFSIDKYRLKGKKYGQLVEITAESTSSERISNDEYDKDQIHDFALWKKAKEDEPAWDFDLNGADYRGRPGWHIECSAMSVKYLDQPFDIHTGGVDLKFPHHENEIAQSTAVGEEDALANFFFHSQHLLVDQKKMAKSEGNVYLLKDIIEKGFEPMAFRLFVLQGHYQRQLNFSWSALESAQFRLNTLRNIVELSFQSDLKQTVAIKEVFKPILANMHTPELLANIAATEENIGSYLMEMDQVLGLQLQKIEDAPKEVYELIDLRTKARQDNDFSSSDSIRKQVEELGFTLKDTPNKTYWQRAY